MAQKNFMGFFLILALSFFASSTLGAKRKSVEFYEFRSSLMTVNITNWGATIQSIYVQDSKGFICLNKLVYIYVCALNFEYICFLFLACMIIIFLPYLTVIFSNGGAWYIGKFADVVLGFDGIGPYIVRNLFLLFIYLIIILQLLINRKISN